MHIEWKSQTLGELIENFDSIRVPIKEGDRRPGPYPYYGASGVIDHVDDYLFDGEYLLIAEDGENLRTRNTPIAFLAQDKFWVNNHAHVVRGNDRADTRFLMYALAGADISGYLTGSTIPKLTQGNLSRIIIPSPPLEEQRAIAHILGTLDDKIELNRRMSATLEAMARALFKSWFVNFDPVWAKQEGRDTGLPPEIAGLFPDRLVDSELGEMPDGWKVTSILDFAELLSGGTPNTSIPEYWDGDIYWVSAKDVRGANDSFVIDTERKVTQSGIENSSAKILPAYTSVVTARGTVGSYCLLPVPMAINQTNYGLKSKLDNGDYFVFFSLANMVEWLQRNAYGTIFDTITTRTFEQSKTIFPTLSLVNRFEETVSKFMGQVRQNLYESTHLSGIRNALIPELISGNVRIEDAAEFLKGLSL